MNHQPTIRPPDHFLFFPSPPGRREFPSRSSLPYLVTFPLCLSVSSISQTQRPPYTTVHSPQSTVYSPERPHGDDIERGH